MQWSKRSSLATVDSTYCFTAQVSSAAPPASAPSGSNAAFGSDEPEEVLEEAPDEPEPWRPAAPTPAPWAPPRPPAAAPWAPAPPAPASFAEMNPAPAAPEPAATPSHAAEVAVPADMVAQIAQRVVAQISEKVVREVAWEVIPDLAEALIKKEIERLKAELQQT